MLIFAGREASLQSPGWALAPGWSTGKKEQFSQLISLLWQPVAICGFPARACSQFPARAALPGALKYRIFISSLQTPSSASSCNPFEAFVTGAMIIYCVFTQQPQTPAQRREIFILPKIQPAQGSPKPSCPTRLVAGAHQARAGYFLQFFFWSRWFLRTIPTP